MKIMSPTYLNIRILSLIILSLQTSTMVLLLRYSRTVHSQHYLISTAVLLSEALKLLISLNLLLAEGGYVFSQLIARLKKEIILDIFETLKLALPAGLYVLQNNLLFVALSNLDAATYQVTYQLKILTTAIFSWVLLGKRLGLIHWFSLALLMTGVSLVQIDERVTGTPPISGHIPEEPNTGPPPKEPPEEDPNGAHPNLEASWLLGVLSVFVSCLLSGFSGVYFERLVKKERNSSLIIKNIQLGVFSLVFAGVAVFGDRRELQRGGFFQGYSASTWAVVVLQAVGGLIVSLTMKYADNILKGFATSFSIVMSTLISWVLLGDHAPTLQFVIGASIVIGATFMYGAVPPTAPRMDESGHKVLPKEKMISV